MTWFKVDDSFYDHPKVFDLPDSALALWLRAGCWSARNLTDGFVPAKMPARLCDDPETAIAALVEPSRGMWRRTRGGYQFHDWDEYQPSAAEVKDLREKRAEAGRKGGQAKAAKQKAGKPVASASPVAKQNAAPARPDPSRRDGGSVGDDQSSVADARARPDDDEDQKIDRQIALLLHELTGRLVDAQWAAKIRAEILTGRSPDNPAAYVATCIRKAPRDYLPAAAPPSANGLAAQQRALRERIAAEREGRS